MSKIDLEKERKKLDREVTFFHFERALRKISKCIKEAKRRKDKFFLCYFLAQNQIINEDFYQGINYLDKAIAIRETDGCSYNDKALCLAELGKHTEALEVFNKGIKKDPNCTSLYHNKGWLLNLLAKHKEAVICFHKALELDPRRPEVLYSLADSYFHLNKRDLAAKYFKRALAKVKGRSSYVYGDISRRLKGL